MSAVIEPAFADPATAAAYLACSRTHYFERVHPHLTKIRRGKRNVVVPVAELRAFANRELADAKRATEQDRAASIKLVQARSTDRDQRRSAEESECADRVRRRLDAM